MESPGVEGTDSSPYTERREILTQPCVVSKRFPVVFLGFTKLLRAQSGGVEVRSPLPSLRTSTEGIFVIFVLSTGPFRAGVVRDPEQEQKGLSTTGLDSEVR